MHSRKIIGKTDERNRRSDYHFVRGDLEIQRFKCNDGPTADELEMQIERKTTGNLVLQLCYLEKYFSKVEKAFGRCA